MRHTLKQLTFLFIALALVAPLGVYAEWSLSGIIFSIAGVLLGMAAGILDMAIANFVLQMGNYVGNSTPIGSAIEDVWTVVRDIVNLTFIFGLLYVGILTIVGKAGGDTKRLVASIIVGAILVNFSLFISRAIIDIANVASVEIYQTMGLAQLKGVGGQAGITVSEAVMARAGLFDLATNGYNPDYAPDMDDDAYIPFVVGGSVFLIVTTFVFAAAGILLIIRFGMLIILMALSPVAFVSKYLPVVGGWGGKWWDALIRQALFAPAFLFMMYVTLLIGSNFQDQTQNFENIFKQGQFESGYSSAIYFLLLIVGMVASIIIAKQIGAYGAATALSWGKTLRKNAQSYIGRNTVGRLSSGALRVNERLEGSRTGRNFKRALSVASFGTFTERDRQRTFKAGADAKFGGRYSRSDDVKFDEAQTQTRSREERRAARREHIRTGIAENATPEQTNALGGVVRGMNNNELLDTPIDTLANQRFAAHLTPAQIQALQASDRLTAQERDRINNARTQGLVALAETQPNLILNRAPNQIAQLPHEVLTHRNVAPQLPESVISSIINAGALTPEQRRSIRDQIIQNPNRGETHEWLRDDRLGRTFR